MNPLLFLVTGVFAGGGLVTLLWVAFFFGYSYTDKRKKNRISELLQNLISLDGQALGLIATCNASTMASNGPAIELAKLCERMQIELGLLADNLTPYQIRYFEKAIAYCLLVCDHTRLEHDAPASLSVQQPEIAVKTSKNTVVLSTSSIPPVLQKACLQEEILHKENDSLDNLSQAEPGTSEPEESVSLEVDEFDLEASNSETANDEAFFDVAPLPRQEVVAIKAEVGSEPIIDEPKPLKVPPPRSSISSISLTMVSSMNTEPVKSAAPLENTRLKETEALTVGPLQQQNRDLEQHSGRASSADETDEVTFEVPFFKQADAAEILLKSHGQQAFVDLENLISQSNTVSISRSMLGHGPSIEADIEGKNLQSAQKPYVVPDHLAVATALPKISKVAESPRQELPLVAKIRVPQKEAELSQADDNGMMSGDDIARSLDSLFGTPDQESKV